MGHRTKIYNFNNKILFNKIEYNAHKYSRLICINMCVSSSHFMIGLHSNRHTVKLSDYMNIY